MCGIAGFWGAFPRPLLDTMSASIAHRGPDGAGSFYNAEAKVGLAHRRLAIIELGDAGAQPMAETSRGVTLIYNGELYNFRDLRRELEKCGHAFRGASDTEVVLRSYLEWGDSCLERLEGIFALAIWDTPRRQLLIARDHLGVKPLYYTETARGIAFASELKAICHLKDLDRAVDRGALQSYLTHLWSPGEQTPFRAVKKLLPGHVVTVTDGHVAAPRPFFQLSADVGTASLEESLERLEASLVTAVSRQLVADVPVGAFLSGGLDSSAVVALATRLREAPLPAYCIDYDANEARREGLVRDAPYAARVAEHLDVDLRHIVAEPFHVEDLAAMVEAMDEPQADPAPLYVGQIARAARAQGVRVLLSGAGGDDLLTGYRRHRALQLERMWRWAPKFARSALRNGTQRLGASVVGRRVRKAFAGADLPEDERIVNYFCWTDPARSAAVAASDSYRSPMLEFLRSLPPKTPPLQKMLLLELRFFLPDHNLNYTDKLSMQHGVEVRVPLVDLEVVRAAAAIPLSLKQRGREGKWIFKKLMERYLPRDVIYRPKTGFGAPVRSWLRGPLAPLVQDVLMGAGARVRTHLDEDALRDLINDDREGRIDGAYTILSALCIELWLRRFESAPAGLH